MMRILILISNSSLNHFGTEIMKDYFEHLFRSDDEEEEEEEEEDEGGNEEEREIKEMFVHIVDIEILSRDEFAFFLRCLE